MEAGRVRRAGSSCTCGCGGGGPGRRVPLERNLWVIVGAIAGGAGREQDCWRGPSRGPTTWRRGGRATWARSWAARRSSAACSAGGPGSRRPSGFWASRFSTGDAFVFPLALGMSGGPRRLLPDRAGRPHVRRTAARCRGPSTSATGRGTPAQLYDIAFLWPAGRRRWRLRMRWPFEQRAAVPAVRAGVLPATGSASSSSSRPGRRTLGVSAIQIACLGGAAVSAVGCCTVSPGRRRAVRRGGQGGELGWRVPTAVPWRWMDAMTAGRADRVSPLAVGRLLVLVPLAWLMVGCVYVPWWETGARSAGRPAGLPRPDRAERRGTGRSWPGG